METAIGYDQNGRGYVVYRVKLNNAHYVDINADLADQHPDGPEAFVQAHIDFHKKELGLP